MKKIILSVAFILSAIIGQAQTVEELKAEQAPKKATIATLQGEVNAIQAKIDALPGGKQEHLELSVVTFLVLTTGILKLHRTHLLEI